MLVTIRTMTEDEFESFHQRSVESQAEELKEELHITQDMAMEKAIEEFAGMLPDGLNTKHNYLMAILEESSKEIAGYIWTIHEYTDGKKQSFLCDFVILESKRRKGYGAEALRLVEQNAADAGCLESVLFVADQNNAARMLYEKCGYQVLRKEQYGTYMIKQL